MQAKFLSGRYRTDSLFHHFGVSDNLKCSLSYKECNSSLEHLLLQCETLSQCYKTQMNMIEHLSPPSRKIVLNAKSESLVSFMQLLLDPSVIPEAIKENQSDKTNQIFYELFQFSRTWCYNVHMRRLKLLGRWRNNF